MGLIVPLKKEKSALTWKPTLVTVVLSRDFAGGIRLRRGHGGLGWAPDLLTAVIRGRFGDRNGGDTSQSPVRGEQQVGAA